MSNSSPDYDIRKIGESIGDGNSITFKGSLPIFAKLFENERMPQMEYLV